jgi:predicted dehydrogenase
MAWPITDSGAGATSPFSQPGGRAAIGSAGERRSAGSAGRCAALNVAQVYAQFADDLRTGAHGPADFEAGLRLHRLLDTIRLSAQTGTRQPVLR